MLGLMSTSGWLMEKRGLELSQLLQKRSWEGHGLEKTGGDISDFLPPLFDPAPWRSNVSIFRSLFNPWRRPHRSRSQSTTRGTTFPLPTGTLSHVPTRPSVIPRPEPDTKNPLDCRFAYRESMITTSIKFSIARFTLNHCVPR